MIPLLVPEISPGDGEEDEEDVQELGILVVGYIDALSKEQHAPKPTNPISCSANQFLAPINKIDPFLGTYRLDSMGSYNPHILRCPFG